MVALQGAIQPAAAVVHHLQQGTPRRPIEPDLAHLADTAPWVYPIHQPLVIVGLWMFRPLHLAWSARAAAV